MMTTAYGIREPGYYAIRYDGTELKRNSAFGQSETTRFVGGLKPNPTLCFSGNSRVHLQNKGWIGISDVKIGDKVLVSAGKYEEVYSFGHRNIAESAQFLQIYSNDTDAPIEISADHLILVDSEHWVPAGTVRVGDCVDQGRRQSLLRSLSYDMSRVRASSPPSPNLDRSWSMTLLLRTM
jgi:3D (Asp-Asp-Asp) domain-containing protein